MRFSSASFLLVGIALLAWDCGARGGAGATTERAAPSRDRNVLTAAELSHVPAVTLLEALRVLRPQWLRKTAPKTMRLDTGADIVVYLDRARLGGIENLREINRTAVAQVRYYSPSEAEGLFGQGHIYGAIVVTSAK